MSGLDSSGNYYYDPNGNKYNVCNMIVGPNYQEYYIDQNQVAGKKVGGTVSIPIIISSITMSLCCMSSIIYLIISNYKSSEYKLTITTFLLIVICLCCFSSLIGNIFQLIGAKNQSNDTIDPKNYPDSRPCYSIKQKKII